MAGVMETAIWLASGFRPAATAGGFLNQRPATDNGAGLSLTSARRPTTAQGFFELAPGDADSLGAKKFTFFGWKPKECPRARGSRSGACADYWRALAHADCHPATLPALAHCANNRKAGRRCRAVSWISFCPRGDQPSWHGWQDVSFRRSDF
jgi:hypothetical protein